ncbi:hypothetical protein QJS10_CPB14g01185 [Acorus calamus]|uniref:Uncharacterized protein n=1 Tax=Acorus calamus TaxID=4465 RepID=A0AAV9DAI5_ACOCL|nr:hypothetical protein QJS10_CPB14g01185 [Acorus calamus]
MRHRVLRAPPCALALSTPHVMSAYLRAPSDTSGRPLPAPVTTSHIKELEGLVVMEADE